VGRYVVACRDGELRFFNAQLDLLMTYHVERPSQQGAVAAPTTVRAWVTDVVCMVNVGVLAVFCTPGFIAFYSATGLVQLIVVVDKLEICASSVDYWSASAVTLLFRPQRRSQECELGASPPLPSPSLLPSPFNGVRGITPGKFFEVTGARR